jgi:hypothetical protein
MTTKVAVIQKPPVLLNRTLTIDAVLTSIQEAVGEGASLLIFPEAYIPGYLGAFTSRCPGFDFSRKPKFPPPTQKAPCRADDLGRVLINAQIGCPLLGVKRQHLLGVGISAFDPKRT